jgi:hypothetical protein
MSRVTSERGSRLSAFAREKKSSVALAAPGHITFFPQILTLDGCRHPGESRGPGFQPAEKTWAPAFAGVTIYRVSPGLLTICLARQYQLLPSA